MPTYDYECDACGHRFEAFQSMRDDALTVCPECSKPTLRRLISGGTGVIFRGSGFYVNDSKRNSSGSTKTSAPSTTTSSTEKTADTNKPDNKGGDAKSEKTSTEKNTGEKKTA